MGLKTLLTKHTKKSAILLFGLLFGIVVISFLTTGAGDDVSGEGYVRIRFENTEVNALIADTPDKRHIGLSGMLELREGEGMFFIFEAPGKYGIWMPDMRFAIDIIWLDSMMTVVDIKENATPESYPDVFKPSQAALYVLEVTAGYASKHGISKGDSATLHNVANK